MKKLSIVLNIALLTVLAWVLVGAAGAGGASLQYVNLPAVAFAGVPESLHNDGNATVPDACADQKTLQLGSEFYGQLDNAAGSFLSLLRLPQGARVTSLSLAINDFDNDNDGHAYLVRKLVADGTTPKSKGYRVMGSVSSSGAEDSMIRTFTDDTIEAAVVDNTRYMYYVELVVCPFVEPFMVQVTYSG